MATRRSAPTPTPPAEGERRAQRGYSRQYESSAAAIYAALERGELEWVGLADPAAGIADDLLLGAGGCVVGHQFKSSQFPGTFRLGTLLLGAEGLLQPLVVAWRSLKQQYPDKAVEICLVTNDYPSTSDALIGGTPGHSAAFLGERAVNPKRTLSEWRATKWQPFIDRLSAASGLDESSFETFLHEFQLLHGPAADFVQSHRLPPEAARLVAEIAKILPQLIADPRNKHRWTRAELLHELGWRDSAIPRHAHQFPVGTYVQRNIETENELRKAVRGANSGYISLVGPPGAGKSTLLQTALEAEAGLIVARYLAYVPGAAQGIGRGEAEDFLDDLATQLKRSGLLGIRFRDETLHERREQFGALLHQAGQRFQRENVRTLIVVDGLDHVPREEKPQRSFLAELPLPCAIPDGVLFVLGTQRLDLEDLRPAVSDQAASEGRRVSMSPLRREAVHRLADILDLNAEISRDRVFDLSRGHPLVTRYLIEALRDADTQRREALLAGAMVFEGDVETVYESAWRGIRDDDEAKQVLGFIVRAEAPMPLHLLAKAVSEQAIERALKSTKHLLTEVAHGWTVFHNSFRLFVLEKPRMRLGKPDSTYSAQVYRELAELARTAPADSPQRWLQLRYLSRAQEHTSVLDLALPARFRQQLSEGRSFSELQADLRLAFASAKHVHDATVVFRLLLATDELGRRRTALHEASALIDAFITIGDIDSAEALAEEIGAEGYKVVDALLSAGEFGRARALFEKLEPLQQLISGTVHGHELHHSSSELIEWAWRVIHFRDAQQINQAINRLAAAALDPDVGEHTEPDTQLAEILRLEVSFAMMAARPDADADGIAHTFFLPAHVLPHLLVHAGLCAASFGFADLAMSLLRRATAHENFAEVQNPSRRHTAIVAFRYGEIETARAIFSGLRVPAVSDLDDQTGDGVSENIARAVIEHAHLAAMLGHPIVEAPASKRPVLRPLQLHANAIGSLLGRAQSDSESISHGKIARAARAVLAYLERARPGGSEEFYAVHQIAAATPILGTALIKAAALRGPHEFSAVVSEFDRAFQSPDSTNGRRANLRREIALEIYRANGDSEEASRRLEPLVESLQEDTPTAQVESLAELATSFARVGNVVRARDLLARVHGETLGYAVAPKKDPQYATWLEFLARTNKADPRRCQESIALLMRQVQGMMDTEGRHSAYRMASSLITEAAMFDCASGLATARALVDWGTIGWASAANALMLGIVKRRGELAQAAAVTWCSLALPYYIEPYYRQSYLGEFIECAIEAASQNEVPEMVVMFRAAIEAEARTHERAALLEKLNAAVRRRGVTDRELEEAVTRWKAESPPPRHTYTPGRYDDVSSLTELSFSLERDSQPDGVGYEAPRAFNRLASAASFTEAKEIFERWAVIRRDSRARFVLVNLAIDEGQLEEARRLLQDYEVETDDRATWTAWTGGTRLRYFKAHVRLDGAAAHRQAYDNFVSALAAGRESISSVLHEIEDILPVITESPDWPAMWDWLAQQIATTREHALGRPFDMSSADLISDEELVAALFEWAMRMPLSELHRHARVGALRLNSVPRGPAAFAHLVRLLLAGQHDEPAEALQLLLLDSRDSLSQEFGDAIAALVEHPDYAVAEPASIVTKRWQRETRMTPAQLPPFYQFILQERDDDFQRPQLVDPESGAMRIENPLGWTFAFPELISMLVRPTVSAEHIRHRCRMFIEQWGGLAMYGQSATDRLRAELHRLEMRMRFARPHLAVAARALRYVAGELRRAGMIDAQEIPFLLYMMGFPAPRLPVISPVPRPLFVPRPRVDDSSWQDSEEEWLRGIDSDVRPLLVGNDTLIAEMSHFEVRNIRRMYKQARMRAPFLKVGEFDDLHHWFELLPEARWANGIRAMTKDPAPTIVRRLSGNYMPEVPEFMLTICPLWLRRLGWHPHVDNWLVFVDKAGEVVAKIVWWRDGGPVDIDDDVIWGEGVYVSLTPSGRAQVEAIASQLTVLVNARRDVTPDSEGRKPRSRHASSRD